MADVLHSDVIVVGAGPAGAAASYDLAAAGFRVSLLDRRSFPRQKACAGGVTVKALNRLRFSIAPVIRFVARDLQVSLNQDLRTTFKSKHPIAALTVREELDDFCLKQAQAKGAQFSLVSNLAKIVESDDSVRVETSDGRIFEASYLVGADGANSRVRRLMGCAKVASAFAVEGLVPIANAMPASRMYLDFAAVPDGYGWVFPKGDHLNVGLYTRRPGLTFTRSDLEAYARTVAGAGQIDDIIGSPLGVGGDRFQQPWTRVFLIGDAAGSAEVLLGEGIHNAIKSGQAAAAAIIRSRDKGTSAQSEFRKELRPVKRDIGTCSDAARIFYGNTRLAYGTLRLRPSKSALMRGFAAGKTIRGIVKTAPLSPFYAIDPVADIVEFENGQAREEAERHGGE
ncbi:MAG: geranylgeranyl reductase family protein [Erythrobacter sp.]